ncbi:MAG: HD domain-containing protein [Clostridia bacterium]|nr:HD domain-containing protein [Clostridia bacterium]
MILDDFAYIACPVRTGSLMADIQALLEANGKPKTFRHVLNVSEANAAIAAQYGLNADKCRAAALLHDVSAVVRPADMLAWADDHGLDTCEAERKHPFLLHQRLSRLVAADYFGIEDEEILSPIECHTTLKEAASPCDMALFIADKLAWDQEGTPPFFDAVSAALERSLEAASLAYMDYMEDNGLLLCPHVDWTAARRWLKRIV